MLLRGDAAALKDVNDVAKYASDKNTELRKRLKRPSGFIVHILRDCILSAWQIAWNFSI